jgi:hypothetical protein
MITNRVGDIFAQPDLHALVHQANCFHVMGAGIARSIKMMWPEVYEADKMTTVYGDPKKLGTFSKAKVRDGKLWVYNLYSQYDYRPVYPKDGVEANIVYHCRTDYQAMEKGLIAINHDLNCPGYYEGGVIKIGIPYKMGCSLAGGDWKEVLKVLEEVYMDDDKTYRDYELIICRREWDGE